MTKVAWLSRNAWRFVAVLKSPRQIKHLRRHAESLREGYMLDAPTPWLAFDAIDFIAGRLSPQWNIFEYGSGGSTLYWLKRGAELVSIEHEAEWYSLVNGRVRPGSCLDYRLVQPELGRSCAPTPDIIADPDCYASNDPLFLSQNFRRYVSQIDEFPDQTFDMVIVDGRARPSCLKHSTPKVKMGGLLVLDNSDREYYLRATRSLLTGFLEHRFRGLGPGLPLYLQTQTSVFEKVST